MRVVGHDIMMNTRTPCSMDIVHGVQHACLIR